MQEQHWQDVLSGPVPTGDLTYDFVQLAISASPHKRELELQDFARQHNVTAAVSGRQADLDLWISKLRTAAHQRLQHEQQVRLVRMGWSPAATCLQMPS